MKKVMEDFLNGLDAATKTSYACGHRNYTTWLAGRDPLKVSLQDLLDFQKWLASEYRSPNGKKLSKSTQCTRLAAIKAFYRWLHRRGDILIDPSIKLKLPKTKRRRVACDCLTQQELSAVLETQRSLLDGKQRGSRLWACEHRNLAMLALGFALGRRSKDVFNLRLQDIDEKRNEVRVDWEKGKPGRVYPVSKWAINACMDYVNEARPILASHFEDDEGWLFVGLRTQRVCVEHLGRLLQSLQQETAERNPDLTELAGKRLKTHSIRTTYATVLFLNGANLRVVNELLGHEKLSTTALYTPLGLDDVRRALRLGHPRA